MLSNKSIVIKIMDQAGKSTVMSDPIYGSRLTWFLCP